MIAIRWSSSLLKRDILSNTDVTDLSLSLSLSLSACKKKRGINVKINNLGWFRESSLLMGKNGFECRLETPHPNHGSPADPKTSL